LFIYRDPEANPNLIVEGVDAGGGFRGGSDGGLLIDREQPKHGRGPNATLRLRELWDVGAVNELSMLPNVKGVTSIGCVLAVEVDDGVRGRVQQRRREGDRVEAPGALHPGQAAG
jgi:dethiobiotin synthetase/adenosylmethionine--8-amino-7-oxononanoate aminotransferase